MPTAAGMHARNAGTGRMCSAARARSRLHLATPPLAQLQSLGPAPVARQSRYDWQRYRLGNRSIFRLGRYYAPYRDYRYRRLSIGARIGNLFFGSRYWINDPGRYRLPAVYGPYRWVRYYDDVLLVDIYSGEVVDVIHDFFW